jgi:hypothetical protein
VPDDWEGAAMDKLWLWCRAAKGVAKCDSRERPTEAKP